MPMQAGNVIDTDLIIVSNRQPYRHTFDEEAMGNEIEVDRPCGGVVAGLDTVATELGGTWIAWGDGDADRVVADPSGKVPVPPGDERYTLDRLWLDEADVAGYYEGYANRVLWPLCHSATGAISYRPGFWDRYRDVNRRFAQEVLAEASPDATVWFQDYHLALAPEFVRETHNGVLIYFCHIPWPPADIFRICPQRQRVLEGLLANDLVAFHVESYVDHFLACVDRFVPDARVDYHSQQVEYGGRTVRVGAFPLGVDVSRIEDRTRGNPGSTPSIDPLPEGRIVLGVDRVDYTKGIPQRLDALEFLWAHRPDWRQRFTYVQKEMASREGIPAYQELQETLDRRTAAINARFGTDDWTPIVRIDRYLPDETLYDLYRRADVMLVSALRDGMNLVAQEYVAAQLERDGVLVLSEFAGSHVFLGDHAVSINPYDTEAHADAIARAVSMQALERNRRMRALHRRVRELDIEGWIESNLRRAREVALDRTRARRPGE